MQTIQSLCAYYGVPVVDTIAAFAASGRPYEALCKDFAHPNDAGHALYADAVLTVIDAKVQGGPLPATGESATPEGAAAGESAATPETAGLPPVDPAVEDYAVFRYYPAASFEKLDELTYVLRPDQPLVGKLGIDSTYVKGKNLVAVYADATLLAVPSADFDFDMTQRHIELVAGDIAAKQELRLVFSTPAQAANFWGVAFCPAPRPADAG